MPLLQGVLADRDTWSAVGECSIEKTMAALGTKSAMLIMREAYYGTTRFDDFAQRVGITKAAAAARLSELVDLGLLVHVRIHVGVFGIRDDHVRVVRLVGVVVLVEVELDAGIVRSHGMISPFPVEGTGARAVPAFSEVRSSGVRLRSRDHGSGTGSNKSHDLASIHQDITRP